MVDSVGLAGPEENVEGNWMVGVDIVGVERGAATGRTDFEGVVPGRSRGV